MIPAASLILIRGVADADPELLMVERSAAMTFAAGAFVFPGGRIDPADEALASAMGKTENAAKIAALRECLEESAIAAGLRPCPDPELARDLQDELLAGRDFADLLEARALALNLDALTPFARWRPGPEVSRRFDTCFFIAQAGSGDLTPRAASGECVSARWTSARAMLEAEHEGAAKLIFPTRKNLERLALHRNFAAILADAQRHAVAAITPVVEADGGAQYVCIPDGLGFPVTRELLSRSNRE